MFLIYSVMLVVYLWLSNNTIAHSQFIPGFRLYWAGIEFLKY